jgi:hypothetical protein
MALLMIIKAKSLRLYCDKYTPELAIRTSMSDYRQQDWMVNVPLYGITNFENIEYLASMWYNSTYN